MCENRRKAQAPVIEEAKELGHTRIYHAPSAMCDQYKCTCGWKSNSYFDNEEAAFAEWFQHIQEVIAASENEAQK